MISRAQRRRGRPDGGAGLSVAETAGLSVAETAAGLEISEGTVSRLLWALAALRTALEEGNDT